MIYIDPVGGETVLKDRKHQILVLITDVHGDHLNAQTLKALNLENVALIAPKAVIDKLPETIAKKTIVTLNNGDIFDLKEISVEAIPMYNLCKEALKFHTKGRGNGYVVTLGNERIYISGDTEDILEMRTLKNIDKAFICMNLPYTMMEESAANAVLEFKPKTIYPYHYRGTQGLSDVKKFKAIVNKGNTAIEVVQLD